ncbi:helix-turn-helix transcriptional regulator [Adlercreutzia sp. ZJ138]|uniref:helix-turn-helix transcriptional regulator n=1 Tax=Adlercreutzia sp. ZJ138 TaxID=2709405 RepID=UPI0013EAAC86|nr:helix-turn-helix transcriptional regulator [Adlercreutzia sp. ZJ138]
MIAYASSFIAPYGNMFSTGAIAPNPYYISAAIIVMTPAVLVVKKCVVEEEKALVAPIAALSLVGSVLLLIYPLLGRYQFTGFVVGALVMGFCDVFLLFSWVAFWSTLASSGTLKSICLSYVLAFALYQLFAMSPHAIQSVFVVIALPVSAFCLIFGGDELRRSFPAALENLTRPHIKKKGELLASVAALHGIFGISQVSNRGIGGTLIGELTLESVLPAGFLILGITLVISRVRTPETHLKILYQSVFLSIVLYVVLVVMPVRFFPEIAFGLMRFAMFSLDTLTILVATDYAYRAKVPIWKTFGLFFLAGRASSFAGFLALSYGAAHVNSTNNLLVSCLLGCLVAATVVQMVVFTQQDLIDIMAVPVDVKEDKVTTAAAQIDEFSQVFGLSPRESEVMEYLLRGYTVAHLSEKLFISPNTGKRHVSNIYRKLGIYNKQSLIEMFAKYFTTK